jgi:hypothetical protein
MSDACALCGGTGEVHVIRADTHEDDYAGCPECMASERLAGERPTWQELPDCLEGVHGVPILTEAYRLWRIGGELWVHHTVTGTWLRLPEPPEKT